MHRGKGHVNQNIKPPGTTALGNKFVLLVNPIRILKQPESLRIVTCVAAVTLDSIFLSDFYHAFALK